MLNYNTKLHPLKLPEYGRNIQQMVEHCLSIPDREERTQCAHTIIRAMGNLIPELRAPENAHKLWDHLMIMADFKLDIDFPEPVIGEADLQTQPDKVPYPQAEIRFRHYGRLVPGMINQACEMPEGEERHRVVMLIANHMKKQMLAVNPEGVDDRRIFHDILELSRGTLHLNPETDRLHEFKAAPVETKKKRKKKA